MVSALVGINLQKESDRNAAFDTFCNLYFTDSHGDFCRAQTPDRSAFVGGYYDFSSVFRDNSVSGFREHRCHQADRCNPKEEAEGAALQ